MPMLETHNEVIKLNDYTSGVHKCLPQISRYEEGQKYRIL